MNAMRPVVSAEAALRRARSALRETLRRVHDACSLRRISAAIADIDEALEALAERPLPENDPTSDSFKVGGTA